MAFVAAGIQLALQQQQQSGQSVSDVDPQIPTPRFNHYSLDKLLCSQTRRQPLPPTRYASGKSHRASPDGSLSKKKKLSATQVYERDILCLPMDYPRSSGVFSFTRGKLRIDLGIKGLVGKIRLESCMSEAEIFA